MDEAGDMATCPECGHQEEASDNWLSGMDIDVSYSRGGANLVVCPNCGSVLGGITTAVSTDY
jgi:uncharacterized Zn finger protein